MNNWTQRTMIIPENLAPAIRQLAVDVAGSSAQGMWTTACGPNPHTEPTHYISSGPIWQQFADMIDSHIALSQATGMSLDEAKNILSVCIISPDDPHTVMKENGLVLIEPPDTYVDL